MLLICPHCDARLQLDDAKAPARAFSIRCPKCKASVNHAPTSAPETITTAPTTASKASIEVSATTFERPTTAPPFKPAAVSRSVSAEENAAPGLSEIAKLLAEALQHSDRHAGASRKRPAWDRRKVLVCASPAYRETIAESLVAHDYDVFIADNMAQGLGRMREERMDVVLLDANFDPVEQGVAFITREVRLLRPSERRRLFLVYVTSGVRTMDLHAAFLHNVNLVINPSDVEQLPETLEVSIRHYNALYRPFNRALDVAPI